MKSLSYGQESEKCQLRWGVRKVSVTVGSVKSLSYGRECEKSQLRSGVLKVSITVVSVKVGSQ